MLDKISRPTQIKCGLKISDSACLSCIKNDLVDKLGCEYSNFRLPCYWK